MSFVNCWTLNLRESVPRELLGCNTGLHIACPSRLLLQRRDADICSLIGAMRTVLLLAAVSAADAFAPAAFHLASAPVARNFCKPPASAGLRMAKDAKEGLFSPVGCW